MKLIPGQLYSLLDLMGVRYSCDQCGKDGPSALGAVQAKDAALKDGWSINGPEGHDLCSSCAKIAMGHEE